MDVSTALGVRGGGPPPPLPPPPFPPVFSPGPPYNPLHLGSLKPLQQLGREQLQLLHPRGRRHANEQGAVLGHGLRSRDGGDLVAHDLGPVLDHGRLLQALGEPGPREVAFQHLANPRHGPPLMRQCALPPPASAAGRTTPRAPRHLAVRRRSPGLAAPPGSARAGVLAACRPTRRTHPPITPSPPPP